MITSVFSIVKIQKKKYLCTRKYKKAMSFITYGLKMFSPGLTKHCDV